MGDEGQFILLSALVACLCLVGVVSCVAAVNGPALKTGYLSADTMENARWAGEDSLGKAAFYDSIYPWESRADAVSRFKADANSSMDSLTLQMLKHGVAYTFRFNDTLAREFAAANGLDDIDGVFVVPDGARARIAGCAYDLSADDGDAAYHVVRVATFD
jgi:hypothetical protein